jgi:hypothetical protein
LNTKPERIFYLKWIFLNAISVVMAWFVAWAIISLVQNVIGDTIQVGGQTRITEDYLYMYVLFPVIGLLTGTVQFMLLGRYLPRMAGWIAATFLGWLMPFVIGFIVTRLFVPGNSTAWIVLGLLVLGTAIALPQWWMLRKRVQHAWVWFIVFGLAWAMVGLLNLVTSEPFPVVLGIALLPAIATAIAIWLLLDRLPVHELSTPTTNGSLRV